MVVRGESLALLLKATGGATTCREWWERRPAGCSKAWLSDVSSFEAIAMTSRMVVRLPCVARQRSGSSGWIPLRFWTPYCSWQLGFGPLAFRKESHRLRRPTLLGVSASAEKPRVAAKTGVPVKSKDEGPSHKPEQKVKVRSGVWTRGSRPHCKGLSWRINRWENSIVFSIAFSLPTNWTLRCALEEYSFYYLHIISQHVTRSGLTRPDPTKLR